jgi:hypothetical protein
MFVGALVSAPQDHRSVILLGHGVIELFTNGLVDARCKNATRITSDTRGYPHSARLIILHEIGAIDDREFQRLEWFRKLRNRAAHDPLFQVSPADLNELNERYRDPSRLNELCTHLVIGFWNAHVDDLLPRFASSLNEAHAADLARRGKLPNKAHLTNRASRKVESKHGRRPARG